MTERFWSAWARAFSISMVAVLLSCFLALAGCGRGGPSVSDSGDKPEAVEGVEVSTDDGDVEVETQSTGSTVTMNGRSVMGGWFEHWGYDWEGPVSRDGYLLEYRELDADLSSIAESFERNVDGSQPGSVVFFKFCFADFWGDNSAQLKGVIDEVIGSAADRGLRLIIGNALPVREEDGSTGLVSQYHDYNEFLVQRASESPDVFVYDFYGILAGSDGFLKHEYDVGDSHLNESAYSALDGTFFPLLERASGG